MKIDNPSGGTVAAVVVLALVVIGAMLALGGFFTMIGLGVLHEHLSSAVPALGYGDSFMTNIGLLLVLGGKSVAFQGTTKK